MENITRRALQHAVERNPEEIAFLLLETPIKDHHVIDVEKKRKLEDLARAITKKLSMLELLGYRVEVSVNSHKTFTLKIARRDKDLDHVVYMKVWDPRYRIKAVLLGGWYINNGKWLWSQYIAVDLTYSKTLDEKAVFDFVKKLISLVI